MGWALLLVLAIAAIAVCYVFLIRPLLRRWSVLTAMWTEIDAFELSLWQKIVKLVEGLKVQLVARLVWVPTLIVEAYDHLAPQLTGLDLTPIAPNLPGWVPIAVAILLPMAIDWLRSRSLRASAGA